MKLCSSKIKYKLSLWTTVIALGVVSSVLAYGKSVGIDMPPWFMACLIAWYGLCGWNIIDDLQGIKRGEK